MKIHYIVSTHLGDFETWAVSARKAIANIKWRLFGRQVTALTVNWKVRLYNAIGFP